MPPDTSQLVSGPPLLQDSELSDGEDFVEDHDVGQVVQASATKHYTCRPVTTSIRGQVASKKDIVWNNNGNVDRITGNCKTFMKQLGVPLQVDHVIEIQMFNQAWYKVRLLTTNNGERKEVKKHIRRVRLHLQKSSVLIIPTCFYD